MPTGPDGAAPWTDGALRHLTGRPRAGHAPAPGTRAADRGAVKVLEGGPLPRSDGLADLQTYRY